MFVGVSLGSSMDLAFIVLGVERDGVHLASAAA